MGGGWEKTTTLGSFYGKQGSQAWERRRFQALTKVLVQ